MKTIIMLTITLLLTSSLFSTTWIIKQDGTGDFTTISEAIVAAVNGDTLLVYPGLYYERLNYQGRNVTITSLYDGDQFGVEYIANTVIDGNHEGTVVVFNSGETRNAVLNGFTIRNGEGEFHHSPSQTWAGGIFIRGASPIIRNCHIKHNRAHAGSGIVLFQTGNPLLRGNTISYNHSTSYGAVATTGAHNNLEFCTELLNSIYLNYGGRSNDLFFGGFDQSPVVIDTMTVLNPCKYFFGKSQHVPDNFTLTVNHSKITPVASDLYVSPDGCDSNSGLTSADPLQTIAMAMIKISPDSQQQRTVHVAEGIYSRTLNNQRFPIQLRSYTDIQGSNTDNTILDMEDETIAFFQQSYLISGVIQEDAGSFTLSDFTIINGGNYLFDTLPGAIYIYYTNMPIAFENIVMRDGYTMRCGQIHIFHTGELSLKNIHLYDNMGGEAIRIHNDWGDYLNIYGENIRIRNQTPGPFQPNYTGGYGGGFVITSGDTVVDAVLDVTLVNVEITDCVVDNVDPPWQDTPWTNFAIGGSYGEARVINATIGNNVSGTPSGGGAKFGGALDFELINSVIYGNHPHDVSLINVRPLTGSLSISHSMINGGQDGFFLHQNPNINVFWGEGNLDADPLWMGDAFPEYPYMLSENSPARNAGTLDIPDFEFPEFDLAGNPRIYGDSIDMGAYEWNPNVNIKDDFSITGELPELHDYKLYNYPNPVVSLQRDGGRGGSTGTTISFQLPKEGHVVIDIYNLKGQFVRRVINAFMLNGEHSVFWNGKDELERHVATGFYMYKLEINGKMVAMGRCTFIK